MQQCISLQLSKMNPLGNILWGDGNALIGGIFGEPLTDCLPMLSSRGLGKTVDVIVLTILSLRIDLGLTSVMRLSEPSAALDIPNRRSTMAGVLLYLYPSNGRDFLTTLDIGDLAGHASKDTLTLP